MSQSKVKLNIKNVGIVLKPKVVNEYTSVLPNLVSWFKKRKINVSFIDSEEERVKKLLKTMPKHISFLSLKELHHKMDLNITLGGDGTLLGFARNSDRRSAPIFGVNMGTLGFITEYAKSEFFEGLESLIIGRCEVVKLPLYKVEVKKGRKSLFTNHFLNDTVISKHDISRMFSLSVDNEEENIFNISGDGLIISSPTGSTAYSLAAGGPIISPRVQALVLTPICPHSLTHRPIVISDKQSLKVKVPADAESVMLTIDGQEVQELPSRCIVEVSKSKSKHVKLIANPQRTYFDTLKSKFTQGRRLF